MPGSTPAASSAPGIRPFREPNAPATVPIFAKETALITKDEFATRLLHACAEVKAAEPELTEIDSRFGDADHGLTMVKIATAIEGATKDASDRLARYARQCCYGGSDA